jgi:hypothetical protein
MTGDVKNYPGGRPAVVAGTDGTDIIISGVPIAYHDRIAERVSDLTADAGTNNLDSTAVPAGSVYVIQSVAAVDVDNAPTLIQILSQGTAVYGFLNEDVSPAADRALIWTGAITLKEGDYIRGHFEGVTANDDIVLDVWGFEFKVA